MTEPCRETAYEVLLTTAEAAAVLKLSARTLEDMRWRGGGPRYLSLSRNCIRYRHADLMRWAEQNARFNTSQPPVEPSQGLIAM